MSGTFGDRMYVTATFMLDIITDPDEYYTTTIPASTYVSANTRVDRAGAPDDTISIPAFDETNVLLEAMGFSDGRLDMIAKLDFLPAFLDEDLDGDGDKDPTDAGSLYYVRRELRELQYENVVIAEQNLESLAESDFSMAYEALISGMDEGYDTKISNLEILDLALRTITDTEDSLSLIGLELSTQGAISGQAAEVWTGNDPLYDTEGAGIFSEFGLGRLSDELPVMNTAALAYLVQEIREGIIGCTGDFATFYSETRADPISSYGVEYNATYAHSFFHPQLMPGSSQKNVPILLTEMSTDKLGAELSSSEYEDIIGTACAEICSNRTADRSEAIALLCLSLSRELTLSATQGGNTSGFGTEDVEALDFTLGTLGRGSIRSEEYAGVTDIFDLGNQPGGSLSDYFHATGSSAGTTITYMPFERRRFLSPGGTSRQTFYSGKELIKGVVTGDVDFDTSLYTDWATGYTEAATNATKYWFDRLLLSDYGSGWGGFGHADVNDGGVEKPNPTDTSQWQPLAPQRILYEVMKWQSSFWQNVEAYDGDTGLVDDIVAFAATAITTRSDGNLSYLFGRLLAAHYWELASDTELSLAGSGGYNTGIYLSGDAGTVHELKMHRFSEFYAALEQFIDDNADTTTPSWAETAAGEKRCTGTDLYSDSASNIWNQDPEFSGNDYTSVFEESVDAYSLYTDGGYFHYRDYWLSGQRSYFRALNKANFSSLLDSIASLCIEASRSAGINAGTFAEAVLDQEGLIADGSTFEMGIMSTGSEEDVAEDEHDLTYTVNHSNIGSLLMYDRSGARTKFRKVSLDNIFYLLWELCAEVLAVTTDLTFGWGLGERTDYLSTGALRDFQVEHVPKLYCTTFDHTITGEEPYNSAEDTEDAAAEDFEEEERETYSCFVAGTKITMADGTRKNIEDVIVGDLVATSRGAYAVTQLDPTTLGTRMLYAFNGTENYFVTSEHPFMTSEGWKSISPDATRGESEDLYGLLTGVLSVGDRLVTEYGLVEIEAIDSLQRDNPEIPLYNFVVDIVHEYYADGILVHNKVVKTGTVPHDFPPVGWDRIPPFDHGDDGDSSDSGIDDGLDDDQAETLSEV